ncbi:MAG TPA: PVC-type heme-binding CxxCH protein [Pirellulales bacterium]|nr:PVC-type heme-binding CxxCH protein [Pirellulales bacterium]
MTLASFRLQNLRFKIVPAFALAALGISIAAAARAEGLPPTEALKHFQVPKGFRLQLFASEPEIRQPVSMTFDARGRMWVIQYLQYPTPAGLTAVKVDQYLRTKYDRVPDPPPRGPRGADRITILEDTDGDGHADAAKDFVDGLNLATGLAIGHGGVFVVQAPYLLFYPDQNGDDVPDADPEVLLTGFGLEDAHALANSLQWGPDGWLYGAQGSTVTANIRGVTFQQGIWRYHPRTKKFELFAEGGGNTWGADFDRHGNMIAGTNWGERAMLHQVQGAYYVKGFAKHGELQNPHAYGYFEHVPYTGFKGGHVTCGGIVYQGGSFPEEIWNQYIAANVLSNAIYWHKITRQGSSFANTFGGELVTTDDHSFRPVDCTVGPDGSLFIADWYDKRANHVDPKDDWDRSNGRIYKLVADGTQPVTGLNLVKQSSNDLLKLLTNRNEWYSREARLILAERQDKSILPGLRASAQQSTDQRLAIESLWTLYQCGGFDEALGLELLAHPSEDVRTWTIRLMGDEQQVSPIVAARFLSLARQESSPTVRSQLACTAKRLPAAQGLPLAAALLTRDEDTTDAHIPLLLWWAVEDKAVSDREQVLELFATRDAWSHPLVKEFVLPRLARRYAAGATAEDFAACARLLDAAPGEAEFDILIAGMEKGLQGRKLATVPSELAGVVDRLRVENESRPERIRFAIRLGSHEAFARALVLLSDKKVSQADRLALIDIVGQVDDPASVEPLLKLLNDAEPASIQTAALTALERFADPRIGDAALKLLPQADAAVRTRALTLLCARAATGLALLEAVDRGDLKPDQVPAAQLRQIALFKQPRVEELLSKHWGKVAQETPAEKRARIHGISVSMNLTTGDAVRGKPLFAKHCGICHTLFGEGNKVGPDLTGAERKNREFLLTSIVDPNAVIRKEFFNYNLATKDGRVLTGLIAESTPTTVTILDAKNQRTTVAQDDVETLEPAPQSLMPEKILDELDADQVRDLMRYLQSDAPAPADAGAGR